MMLVFEKREVGKAVVMLCPSPRTPARFWSPHHRGRYIGTWVLFTVTAHRSEKILDFLKYWQPSTTIKIKKSKFRGFPSPCPSFFLIMQCCIIFLCSCVFFPCIMYNGWVNHEKQPYTPWPSSSLREVLYLSFQYYILNYTYIFLYTRCK